MIYELRFHLKKKGGYKCIDREIEDLIPKEGEGIAVISVVGSTGSIILIENDDNLLRDLFEMLDKFAPYNKEYHHHLTWGDDNGASHLRATLLGQTITLPWRNGKLIKGTWQNILVINHDTRDRERSVIVQIIKSK